MQKIDFKFAGFTLTDQPNGTHNLVLYVLNDAAASILYQNLFQSNYIYVGYIISGDFFDIRVSLLDIKQFYELNYHIEDNISSIRYAIDNKLILEIWVGYQYKGSDGALKTQLCGSGLAVHRD